MHLLKHGTYKRQRRSIRLKEYDYSQDGAYFVTICTKAKECHFAKFPELTKIVQEEWEALPVGFPNILIDAFIIMPNHIHAVFFLRKISENVGATLEVAQRAGSRSLSH